MARRLLDTLAVTLTGEWFMSVRWLLPLAGMAFLSVVRPAAASTGPGAFNRDITLFRLVAIESVQRSSGTAESDSTEKKQPFFIAAAGAVGVAAYFIATGGSAPASGLPFTPQDPSSGGVLLPPQDFSTPPFTQPTGSASGGGNIVADSPVTVTPEPATMALLASGLAGMSSMTLRRRLRRP